MNNEPWIVKTRSGAIWGKIHRVMIDSATRQIMSVDVMLGDKTKFIRVPWTSLKIENEDIVLGISEAEVQRIMRPSDASLPDTVTLEDVAPALNA